MTARPRRLPPVPSYLQLREEIREVVRKCGWASKIEPRGLRKLTMTCLRIIKKDRADHARRAA